MLKKKILAASLLFALAGGAQATATFTFDTNGAAVGGAVNGVTTFDWLPGNALAVGGNPSGGLASGDSVTLLYQANLGTVTDGTNGLYLNGSNGFYFTAVAGFGEIATVTNGGLDVSFAMDPAATSFLYVYANTTASGDNLAGTGFTAGTQILSGTLQSVTSSNFSATGATDVFDQFGTDNYPGTTTIVGSGSTDLVWLLDTVDTSFFPDFFSGGLMTTSINSSLVEPFKQVNPSAAFSSDGVADGDLAHNIGTCNGCLQNAEDLNFQFQADANSSFDFNAVPEPGSLALLGLSGLALLRRRRGQTD